jgi:hypothetical protein
MAEPQKKEPSRLEKFMAPAKAVYDHPAVAKAREISDSRGAAPIHAAIRQGADEIAQVLTAFPSQAVQPTPEPGQLFEVTPQEVYNQKTGKDVGPADGGKIQPPKTPTKQKDRGMEMDMG